MNRRRPPSVGPLLLRAPIIVLAEDEPMFFRSVEEAEAYMEPVDVRSGAYLAYEASGRRLKIDIVSARRPVFLGLVTADVEAAKLVAPDEQAAAKDDVAALNRSLRQFLEPVMVFDFSVMP